MGKTGSEAPLGPAMRDCLRALQDGMCLETAIVAVRVATDYPPRLARAALWRLVTRGYVRRCTAGWIIKWEITATGRAWLRKNEEVSDVH